MKNRHFMVYQLTKNLTVEEARTVYDNLLRAIKEPEIRDPLKFLHFNPEFDKTINNPQFGK